MPYTLQETTEIIKNCKSLYELREVTDVIGKYKKSFSLSDLRIITSLIKLKDHYIKSF